MDAKPKGNAVLSGLTPEQQAQVERWLFAENATYSEVVERCRKEFGVAVGVSSVGRHYRREFRGRTLDRLARTLQNSSEALKVLRKNRDYDNSFRTVIHLAEVMAIDEVMKPEGERDFRMVGYLAKVAIAARQETNQYMRAVTMRQKFELDIATECLIHKAKMDEIEKDESLTDEERIRKVREELFGPNLPE